MGDGQFDVWWAVDDDGTVTKEWAATRSEPVDVEAYVELKEAITQRMGPAVDAVPDTEALINRAGEFVDRNLLRSYFVELQRVLDILRSPILGHEPVPTQTALPFVDVEWEASRRRWLVTFADEVAHLRPDLVEDCLEHCRQFQAVESVDWQDRELLVLRAAGLDASRLQAELLALVESGLEDEAPEGDV